MKYTKEYLDSIKNIFKREKQKGHIALGELMFEGEDRWATQFNLVSELFQKWNDETLSKEEQEKYGEMWYQEKMNLEMGIY